LAIVDLTRTRCTGQVYLNMKISSRSTTVEDSGGGIIGTNYTPTTGQDAISTST
jgi:hypothetical protein